MSQISIIISHMPIGFKGTILYNNNIKNIDIREQHFE